MELTGDTRLKDIDEAYPFLREKLPQIDPKFKIINSPLGKGLIKKSTLADVSERAGIDLDKLIEGLQKIIEEG